MVELEMVPRIWSGPLRILPWRQLPLLVYTGTTAGVSPTYTSVEAGRADRVTIQALESWRHN